MITIIDYGMGNLRSVAKAFEALGRSDVVVSSDPINLEKSTHIILPGQGAFPHAIKNLQQFNLIEPLYEEVVNKAKPFLGICLGMQLLAEVGFEHGRHKGIGLIRGRTEKLAVDEQQYKLPHVGWDNIDFDHNCPLFNGLQQQSDFYFLHSYTLQPEDQSLVVATCTYGKTFPVAIWKKNIFATLFHPEKSQKNGLTILRNFINVGS